MQIVFVQFIRVN